MQEICLGDGAAPDIIFLQETNVHSDVLHRLEGLETGWAAAFNNKLVGHIKGTGILVRESKLLGPKTTIEPVYDDSNALFDIIAVKVRSLMLVNVYVHVIREQRAGEVLDELLSVLLHKIIEDHEGPVIVGGDFNLRNDVELLVESMASLELLPVYPDGGEPQPTHDRGGVLDWIFIRHPVTARPLQIIQRGADHAILRSTMSLPLKPEARPQDLRYKWKNLAKLDEEKRREMNEEMEQAGYVDLWICYRNSAYSAKELTVLPGATVTIRDSAAYGLIVLQGHGTMGVWNIETPALIRFGQLTHDEYFVTEQAAREGVQITNPSATDPIVMLKHFGPENPDLVL